MSKRILLKTKDGREFLTYIVNKSAAISFAKKYKAEVYEVNEEDIIDDSSASLENLAVAFCDPDYVFDGNYIADKIEKIHPAKDSSRAQMLKDAKVIREFIERKMRDGSSLSLQEIKDEYKKKEVTDSCLSNHFSQVRKILQKEGIAINRIKKGVYKANA